MAVDAMLCRDAVQGMLKPAEVTAGRHLSACLISFPLSASPEGSLVFRSVEGFLGAQPPRAQRLPVASTRTCEEVGCRETSAHFLSLRASFRLQVFLQCQGVPVSLSHPLEKC